MGCEKKGSLARHIIVLLLADAVGGGGVGVDDGVVVVIVVTEMCFATKNIRLGSPPPLYRSDGFQRLR